MKYVNIPNDIPFLYMAMSAEDQYLYSTKLSFSSMQEFEHWLCCRLKNDFHDFLIIKDAFSLKHLGYVHNYDFSLVDGHCKLVVYIIPECRETGIGSMAAITFMDKLFAEYPLRKLYSTIYDYNKESLKSNLAAGFTEEGILRDYRYYDGGYHNIHYLSISRDDFEKMMRRLNIVLH
ncbi:MAG: GNAT family N-acetyltransferase [Eubacterium sp.]|nr:GNAT family N-acetyltransferase [Eubacterium sp.]